VPPNLRFARPAQPVGAEATLAEKRAIRRGRCTAGPVCGIVPYLIGGASLSEPEAAAWSYKGNCQNAAERRFPKTGGLAPPIGHTQRCSSGK
jgi:hypothetical protein